MSNHSYHRASVARALLGNITPNLIAVAVSNLGEHEIIIRFVFLLPPDEADKEAMDDIATEIMADFSTLHIHYDSVIGFPGQDFCSGLTGVETSLVWERKEEQ